MGLGCVTILALCIFGAFALNSVDSREIGRTNPQRAANYRPPWFNFSETYSKGAALGVTVGSTKAEAIEAAEQAGLIVQPVCWGDDRAGGATLYERAELLAVMLRQSKLCFSYLSKPGGMIVDFHDDRVRSVEVYYVNFEAI